MPCYDSQANDERAENERAEAAEREAKDQRIEWLEAALCATRKALLRVNTVIGAAELHGIDWIEAGISKSAYIKDASAHDIKDSIKAAAIPVNGMSAIHPGVILQEDYLNPAGCTKEQFALILGVDILIVENILKEEASIDEAFAEKLMSRGYGSSMFWMTLQRVYDEKTKK